MLQRQSPPRQYAIVGNDDLSFVANRPAEDVAKELAPHPCASKAARHHQRDYPHLSSPAVEESVHRDQLLPLSRRRFAITNPMIAS
jgi:hypothetical protein